MSVQKSSSKCIYSKWMNQLCVQQLFVELCVFLKYNLGSRIGSRFWYVTQIKFSLTDRNQI